MNNNYHPPHKVEAVRILIAALYSHSFSNYNNNKKLSVPESFLLRFFNKTDHKPHCLHILVKIQRQATS